LNTYGYTLLNSGKTKDAISVFEMNVADHPDSWNVFDSLAEALEKSGDKKGAIKNYEKALRLVADEQNKKRITDTLSSLKK
jgi:predicted Zn-dependent protease